jgi:YbgC/YbaW family acyl-CoA thioester hydrolase
MFRYFESAEIEFLRSLEITYSPDGPLSFPRVHVECDYLVPLVHDDEIEIHVRVGKVGSTSLRFDFQTIKQGALAAQGSVTIVCINRDTKRPVPWPEELKRKLMPLSF